MGTNYYAIPKINKGNKDAIINAVRDENWYLVKSLPPEIVHIGKSSMGWDFLFNHNSFEYYKNIPEMFEWLENCQIINEYGEEISPVDFIDFVNSKKGQGDHRMKKAEWYTWEGDYVFSTSTEFS